MMRRDDHDTRQGYCLVELLVVLSLVGAALALGARSLWPGVSRQEARGTAQSLQAAAAWAQVGVLWHGGEARVAVADGGLSVTQDLGECGGDLGTALPASPVSANTSRWRTAAGVAFSFKGMYACPDSGGSLYVDTGAGSYRVVVRPESGLTARSWSAR